MNLLGDECVFERAIQKELVKKGFCDIKVYRACTGMGKLILWVKLLFNFVTGGTEELLLRVKLLLYFYLNGTEKLLLGVKLLLISI